MGNRLSKIATKTGDKGETGLGDGSRVRKSSARVKAIGDIDELNSWIGLLRSHLSDSDELQPLLHQVQHDLFDLGGELSVPGYLALSQDLVQDLEDNLEALNDTLPPLKEFILPGGDMAASHAHMVRTVCRRAERSLVSLGENEAINELCLSYINRLSDLMFVMARVLARRNNGQEVYWKSRHTQGKDSQE
ncbi:MAG: ATP:cob(I)alamin adenosyltransferase [Oceanospirillaceae bacterium]|uniref:cob(I)yrinic acid a,c-diamide adenosyltransferase n=1 Tax=unclassified Thalassolituus TaxID=2624967 RepID=UPI000C40CEB7|nr:MULTISPECIES: cob(I)yrinic acid a,c-diamide adenosyltransferase [unclassified Thalassolituus]MAS25857.1 ATP:cob(I)alamin adenosyltransferase [Oceanospirillaceae bacterium]MAX98294.1 ATP:cob(I)alamin adenosyltransferase [Oceanospirillaceae bacterium]MBS54094.1 ATP:cob(I)alamin adenosyltransferase [Oceanospirillaceae bacterium]|tara:strand:- start:282 stop:854 length:573 start_codon:yes stop_codon:yes gene_type:complete